jgi:hypothetical protein
LFIGHTDEPNSFLDKVREKGISEIPEATGAVVAEELAAEVSAQKDIGAAPTVLDAPIAT